MLILELILEKRPVNGANLMGSTIIQLSIDILKPGYRYDRNYRAKIAVVLYCSTMDKTEI